MESVVRLLAECFEIREPEAVALMFRVHQEGWAVVRTCPASEARACLEVGRARARAAVMPLRITWRPHAREPERDDDA
jgi:ATP-dependent Clp protease adapter protein ClpS